MKTMSRMTATRDIIVIGASSGGIEAMKKLLSGLAGDSQASFFFVQHIGACGRGFLPQIFQTFSPLPVSNAEDGETILRGHVYVAPPDHHLLLEAPDRMRLTHGPKENRTRPAVDPLFRSAAAAFGPRVIGVILTGHLDDGTAGLWAVKDRAGTTVVQDPEDAEARGMPTSALQYVEIDHCVPLIAIPPLLTKLTRASAPSKAGAPVSQQMQTEINIAREFGPAESGIHLLGEPSKFACPECHGVLAQVKEGSHVRFRCHTGHAYSIETLLAEFDQKTEETLWGAVRTIQERVLLLTEMARQLEDEHHEVAAASSLRAKAERVSLFADKVRELALSPESSNEVPSEK